jgi:hypothetical protein
VLVAGKTAISPRFYHICNESMHSYGQESANVKPRRRQPWDCHRTLQNSKTRTAALKQQEDVCEKLRWGPTEEIQCILTILQVKEFSLQLHRYLLSFSSRTPRDDIVVSGRLASSCGCAIARLPAFLHLARRPRPRPPPPPLVAYRTRPCRPR